MRKAFFSKREPEANGFADVAEVESGGFATVSSPPVRISRCQLRLGSRWVPPQRSTSSPADTFAGCNCVGVATGLRKGTGVKDLE